MLNINKSSGTILELSESFRPFVWRVGLEDFTKEHYECEYSSVSNHLFGTDFSTGFLVDVEATEKALNSKEDAIDVRLDKVYSVPTSELLNKERLKKLLHCIHSFRMDDSEFDRVFGRYTKVVELYRQFVCNFNNKN